MILDNKRIDIKSEGEELETQKMGISIENEAAIIEIVVNFYKNPIESIVREWISNSHDSRKESGKLDKPIIAKLEKRNDGWYFQAIDFGIGINQKTIDEVFTKLGKSTKGHSNDFLGAFGLGSRSGYSYSPYYTVIGRKDGIEGRWIFRRSDEGFTIDTVYNDLPTEEENGAIFEIKVKDSYAEQFEWSNAIRKQLAYFKNVYIDDKHNPVAEDYKIYESEHFKYSELTKDNYLHLCLDDVYYPINFSDLDIKPIRIPIALKFALGEGITPLPARESYSNTEESRRAILEKIKKVADFFVGKYNQDYQIVKTWKEGRTFINENRKHVTLQGKSFLINDLIEHSDESCNGVEIEGFNSKHLKHLKEQETEILRCFYPVANLRRNGRIERWYYFVFGEIGLLSDNTPVGNLKEYLREKYYNHKVYRIKDRKLRGSVRSYRNSASNYWYDALHLEKIPKVEWREYIQEAQKIIEEQKGFMIDISKEEVPKEWLEERKRQNKKVYESKRLDKQDGEVTIAFASASERVRYKYEKETYKISELNKRGHMTIYSTNKEDRNKLEILQRNIDKSKHKTAIIGPREAKKIEGNQHFKTIKQFMETKLFRSFATKYKVLEVINELKAIYGFSKFEEILKVVGEKYESHYKKFKKYYDDMGNLETKSEAFTEELLKYAEENNLYDLEVMENVNLVKEAISKFSFLKFAELPRDRGYYESDEQYEIRIKPFKNFVHRNLIFEKLYKGSFDDWRICPPSENEPKEQPVTEQISEF